MTSRRPVGPSYEEYRPPAPVDGCETCRGFAARRSAARAEFDYSAVSDSNVRLRAHLLDEHSGT
ncbi:hypothetical protein [Streptomyces graminilatus]|uniref:hypothetical protein n=1 Tax=Streptomyces graminilatus TaxID=1464070 RepID=UPI0006E3BF49|nr:hypothetical protein [Streptomyces graminilatus]